MSHTTIRMIERADRNGYRRASASVVAALLNRGTIRLEGVDGDEDANTVVRWYRRSNSDD